MREVEKNREKEECTWLIMEERERERAEQKRERRKKK